VALFDVVRPVVDHPDVFDLQRKGTVDSVH
jgi:hypothetical protein